MPSVTCTAFGVLTCHDTCRRLYFIRDEYDTGKPDNPLGLPAFPYELAFAIQDKMFKSNGELFYPAFPGDPFYKDFIDDENATLPVDIFPLGGVSLRTTSSCFSLHFSHMPLSLLVIKSYHRQSPLRLLNSLVTTWL